MRNNKMMFNRKIVQFLLVPLIIILWVSGNAAGEYSPNATTLPATDVTSTSATLKGEVNPNGLDTVAFFASADAPGTRSHFQDTPFQNIGNGSSYVPVNHTLTGLKPGTNYSYVIKAKNSFNVSSGEPKFFITNFTQPSAPRNLTATASVSSITLNWNAPDNNGGSPILSYRIYRGNASRGEKFQTSVGNTLSYTDTPEARGQTYHYMVSAVNSVGEGAVSNEANATLAPTPTVTPNVIATPTALTVRVASDPLSVAIGQTSTITVIVTADGKEISGANVILNSTKEGKVNPATGTTDLFGHVTSTFTGSAAGKATIKAVVKKEGFEEGKGQIQFIVGPAPTMTVITKLSSITGMITDAKTNEPVQNAKVTIDGISATTGPDGLYELQINAGEYKNLIVTKPGYATISRSVNVTEGGIKVDFSIMPAQATPWVWVILLIAAISASLIYILVIKKGKKVEDEEKELCIHCKAPIPIDSEFCTSCGKKQEEMKRFCMNCGASMPHTSERCPRCNKLPPSGADVKTCWKCGEVIPNVANFCGTCGAGQPI